jgi:hypothetical protein
MENITEIFCFVDDFMKKFMEEWHNHLIASGKKIRNRKSQLSPSEVATIIILFHNSGSRNFKTFYLTYICGFMKSYFPGFVSYSRFIQLQKSFLVPIYYLSQVIKGEQTGIYFIDSTTLNVCNIKREKRNKVFKNIAKKSKSTMGWYFGFKLHLIINNKGEIMSCRITDSTTSDVSVAEDLTEGLIGKIIGDKGYISSSLSEILLGRGLQLITKIKKNMKNFFIKIEDKFLLRKRSLIETVNEQLKNICQIEHSRYRAPYSLLLNVFSGIIAYQFKKKKPSIKSKVAGNVRVA